MSVIGTSHFVRIDYNNISTYRIVYDHVAIDKATNDCLDAINNGTIMKSIRPVLLIVAGFSKTTDNQTKIDDNWLIKILNQINPSFDEVRAHVVTYVYNSLRSSMGTKKSQDQKDRVRALFASLGYNKNIDLREWKNSKFRTDPDGKFITNSGQIPVYLRYGSGNGGSQNDRWEGTYNMILSNPSDKFILIFGGPEVEKRKYAIDEFKKIGNCFIIIENQATDQLEFQNFIL